MSYRSIVPAGGGPPLALVEAIGQFALVIGVMVLVFLAIAFQFLRVRELYGGSDSPTPDQQTNCPSCGARVTAEADTCEYCGDAIEH